MNKFANGKIYMITCKTTDKCYIGSTVTSLKRRLINHEESHATYLSGLSTYITAYSVLQGKNYHIELLQKYNCSSRCELDQKEGFFIKTLQCVNKHIPYEGIKEGYVADYTDRVVQRRFTCDCGSKYTMHHKLRHFKSKKHQKFANEL